MDFTIEPGTILMGYRGSLAHGTYVPSTDPDSIDDIDYMGIVVPSLSYYFGLDNWANSGTKEIWEGVNDIVYYELKKFVGLLLKGNPNVVSMLWLDLSLYQVVAPEGQMLLDNRNMFQSKNAFYTFMGYINSQLSKMGKFNSRGFRGQKRSELITRYGFDTKNAAHAVRLGRMLLEVLETGEWKIDRTNIDAAELKEIKSGVWSQDRVIAEAQRMVALAKDLYKISPLPDKPDYEKASQLVMDILESKFYSGKKI